MARLILDTTFLVSTERRGTVLDELVHDDDDVAVAAITAAELLVGVELADAAHRDARERFVSAVLDSVPVEDYDLAVAREHAKLLAHTRRTGRPRRAHDLIIAATASATERAVVTADVTGFADLPGISVRGS